MRTWQTAHDGILAVRLHLLADRPRPRRRRRSPRATARRAAAAAAARRGCCRAATGRAAPARCGSGYDVTVRMLPCPSRPPRVPSVKRHAPEVAAVDVRDPVVARQPLVHERVVGGQQLARRCGPRAAELPTNSRVSCRNASRRFSSNSGIRVDVRHDAGELAQREPLAREVVDERLRPRGRRASAAPAARSTAGVAAACRASPRRAARRRECCSRGRTRAATRGRGR